MMPGNIIVSLHTLGNTTYGFTLDTGLQCLAPLQALAPLVLLLIALSLSLNMILPLSQHLTQDRLNPQTKTGLTGGLFGSLCWLILHANVTAWGDSQRLTHKPINDWVQTSMRWLAITVDFTDGHMAHMDMTPIDFPLSTLVETHTLFTCCLCTHNQPSTFILTLDIYMNTFVTMFFQHMVGYIMDNIKYLPPLA